MKILRAVARILHISVWTLVLVLIWAVGHGLLRLARRPVHAWRGGFVRIWARGVLNVAGVRVRVDGDPPQAPFILVCNHLSYVDVLVLHSQTRSVLVSKAEVGTWPVIGWLARTFGTLFIDRTLRRDVLRVNARIEEVLQRGDGVVFFPEGTTSRGDRVHRFKASLLDLAAREGWPVHYATISYRTVPPSPPAYLAVCWWGDMTFGDHLWRLMQLPRIEASLIFGNKTIYSDDRKELAHQLEQRVARQFVPVVTPSSS